MAVHIRKVENMAILLTNGTHYIAHNKSGAIIKITDITQAQDFHSAERAIQQRNKHPGKCARYYFIDTALVDITELNTKNNKKQLPHKRHKQIKGKMRRDIYEKTHGHCYLCGDFVDFDSFEVEHRIPLSKGGTNDLDNLFCSCHCCNTLKHDIYLRDFMEKISQIFIYQMHIQYGNSLKWKIINRELSKMM